MRSLQRLWVGVGVLSLICLGGGCTHEWELSNARVDPVANPNGGPAAKVLRVTDARKFEANPDDPKTPTLRDSDDIPNRAVTLRAIGKATNGPHTFYFIYPEGQTVEMAVQGAVENALRNKGYTVVAGDSPSAAGAIPVEVEIRKSWLWWDVGFWTIEADYEVEVEVKGPIVLNGGTETATAHYNMSSAYMASAICESCVGNGLGGLAKDIETKLKSP